METIDRAPRFSFPTKDEAERFCKRMRDATYKYDVVVINDILRDRGLGGVPEGYHYGYDRKTVKKIKPKKEGNYWQVQMPMPGKMVRGENGFWTTVPADTEGG
jgi:hypothetical protein